MQAIDVAIEQVILLGRHFIDAIDIDGLEGMGFGHRERDGPAVDLTGAGKDDFDGWVASAASLQDRKLGETIDLEVGHGIVYGNRDGWFGRRD